MRILVALALCAVLGGPALSQSLPEKTGLNALVGASPSTADFVREAAMSDMFETRSSELAAIRGDEPTRAFAAKMNEYHQRSSSELARIVKPHVTSLPLPSVLDNAHQAMVDKLRTLDGPAFTKQYRDDQIGALKAAVSLFERYGEGGSDGALKAFARKMLPVLREHLRMAETLGR